MGDGLSSPALFFFVIVRDCSKRFRVSCDLLAVLIFIKNNFGKFLRELLA